MHDPEQADSSPGPPSPSPDLASAAQCLWSAGPGACHVASVRRVCWRLRPAAPSGAGSLDSASSSELPCADPGEPLTGRTCAESAPGGESGSGNHAGTHAGPVPGTHDLREEVQSVRTAPQNVRLRPQGGDGDELCRREVSEVRGRDAGKAQMCAGVVKLRMRGEEPAEGREGQALQLQLASCGDDHCVRLFSMGVR